MHRVIQDRLEEVLAEPASPELAAHLNECEDCREEVSVMRRHASMLRALRAPETTPEVRPGFYARVMERIEAQRPINIWELFFESACLSALRASAPLLANQARYWVARTGP